MKFKLSACLATATLALVACGAEPQVDEDEVDPTFEGADDTSSSVGAGALTEAAPEEAVTDLSEEGLTEAAPEKGVDEATVDTTVEE